MLNLTTQTKAATAYQVQGAGVCRSYVCLLSAFVALL